MVDLLPSASAVVRSDWLRSELHLQWQDSGDRRNAGHGVAFELADNMLFQKAQTHPASLAASNFSVSLILEGGKRYYYRAVATNEVGTTRSGPKAGHARFQDHWWSDSSPQAGGWRTSPWFATYSGSSHSAGPTLTPTVGLMKDHGWTRDGAYPYFWKNADGSWRIFSEKTPSSTKAFREKSLIGSKSVARSKLLNFSPLAKIFRFR